MGGCCFTSYKKGLKEKTRERTKDFFFKYVSNYIYILTNKFSKVF